LQEISDENVLKVQRDFLQREMASMTKQKEIIDMCARVDPILLPNGSVYRGQWNNERKREGLGI